MKKHFKLLISICVLIFIISQNVIVVSASTNSCTIKATLLKQGSKGSDVTCLQQKIGMILNKYGTFGPTTKTNIIKFQKSKGLKADGIVGLKTIKILNSEDPTLSLPIITVKSTTETTPICPNGNTVMSNCTISPSGIVMINNYASSYPNGCISDAGYSTTTGQPCGIISSNNSAVSFSQNNISINIGQSSTIILYGNSNNIYYVSNNSNPYVISTTIVSDNLRLQANNYGNSNILVCQSGSTSCSTLSVNVH